MTREETDKVFKAWLDKYEDGPSFCLWRVLPDAFAAGAEHGAKAECKACAKIAYEEEGQAMDDAACVALHIASRILERIGEEGCRKDYLEEKP